MANRDATKIQSAIRNKLARKRVRQEQINKISKDVANQMAATKIQSAFRNKLARKRVKQEQINKISKNVAKTVIENVLINEKKLELSKQAEEMKQEILRLEKEAKKIIKSRLRKEEKTKAIQKLQAIAKRITPNKEFASYLQELHQMPVFENPFEGKTMEQILSEAPQPKKRGRPKGSTKEAIAAKRAAEVDAQNEAQNEAPQPKKSEKPKDVMVAKYAEDKAEDDAPNKKEAQIRIASVYRGHLAGKKVNERIKDITRNNAAITIQTFLKNRMQILKATRLLKELLKKKLTKKIEKIEEETGSSEIPKSVLDFAKYKAKRKKEIQSQFNELDKEDPLYELKKEALMYNIITETLLPFLKRKIAGNTLSTLKKEMEEDKKQAEVLATMFNTIKVSKEEAKEIEESMSNIYSGGSELPSPWSEEVKVEGEGEEKKEELKPPRPLPTSTRVKRLNLLSSFYE